MYREQLKSHKISCNDLNSTTFADKSGVTLKLFLHYNAMQSTEFARTYLLQQCMSYVRQSVLNCVNKRRIFVKLYFEQARVSIRHI